MVKNGLLEGANYYIYKMWIRNLDIKQHFGYKEYGHIHWNYRNSVRYTICAKTHDTRHYKDEVYGKVRRYGLYGAITRPLAQNAHKESLKRRSAIKGRSTTPLNMQWIEYPR